MTDYTDYKQLYLLCFTEDTEEDAELLFKTVLSKAELICEYDNGKPIAMLYLMDSDLVTEDTAYPFYYLYAACTHPDFRGRGIMGRLLEKAKQTALKKGKLGIFLKPANQPLFKFYAGNGFEPFFKVTKIIMPANEFLNSIETGNLDFEAMSMAKWHKKRKDFLSPISDIHADFSKDLFTAATAGCHVAWYENSAAVYEVRDETLLIKEAVCKKGEERELLCLAAALLNKTKCDSIEMRIPTGCDFNRFDKIKAETVHFSVIWDNGALPKETFNNPYHGFAFD